MAEISIVGLTNGAFLRSNSGNWTTARDGGVVTLWLPASTGNLIVPGWGKTASYWFYWAFLFFDTSVLGVGAIINTAKLSLYVDSFVDEDADNDNIYATKGLQGATLSIADWTNAQRDELTNLGSVSLDDVIATQYNDLVLNSDGRDHIDVVGSTRFCLRGHRDFHDMVEPVSRRTQVMRFFATQEGDGYWPKLVVNYTSPGLTKQRASFIM